MDEFIKALEDALKDEDEGFEFYTELAKECYEHGHMAYAQILDDIASEELIHAKHIREILEEISDE